jgi:hypothetical protein
VEGCKGGSFSGSDLLRQHTNAAVRRIRKKRAMPMVAIVRPRFGLPTIIEETEMLNWHLAFSIITTLPGLSLSGENKSTLNHRFD